MIMHERIVKTEKSGIQLGTQDPLISVLPSEPPDSLMVEECRIVLIPKLASNLADC